VAVLVPVCTFGLNWRVRTSKNYILSAASDFVLALVAFDFAAIASYDTFKKVVSDNTLRDSFGPMFVAFLLLTLVLWLWVFMPLEGRMVRGYSYDEGRYISPKPTGLFVLSWVVVAALLAVHIFPFFYGG